jgi:membrane-bound lytic murein transglycosylase D
MFKQTALKLIFTSLFALGLCACASHEPLTIQNGALHYTTSGETNLWLVMGKDFKMNHYQDEPAVEKQIQWYMDNVVYLEKTADSATPYVYYVLQEIKKRKMPSELALLPVVESNYNPFAYSNVGAAGLWQMMPKTATGLDIQQNWWYDGRRDIYDSTDAALNYLQELNERYDGNWLLTIAAYNCGFGTVNNAIKYNKEHHLPTDFWHLNLPRETREYVPKFLAVSIILANPREYPIEWPAVKLAPFLAPVSVGSQIDLAKAAKLADISAEEIHRLNPGFNRWATEPDGDHLLIIPADKVAIFTENLKKLPSAERVTWNRYIVKSGDTLGKIAQSYHTSISLIAEINSLKNNIIRPKQVLLIPLSTTSLSKSQLRSIENYLRMNTKPNNIPYTVQSGDNLGAIAKRFHTTVNILKDINHLTSNTLRPGQIIAIPPGNK